MAGASSRTRDHAKKTTIVLVAENNKFDVIYVLLEYDHNNTVSDDLELAVASHILSNKGTEHYRSQWVLEYYCDIRLLNEQNSYIQKRC
jgi:hypothetical protein